MSTSAEGRGAAPARPWVPEAVGRACLLIGLLDVAVAVLPRLRRGTVGALAVDLPGAVTALSTTGTLTVGFLLVLLAHALRRRKRRAWRAVCLLLPVGAAAHLVHGHRTGAAVVSLALLAVMLVHRREFYALPDPRSRRYALANLVCTGAAALLLGLVVVTVHSCAAAGSPGWGERLQETVLGLFGVTGPIRYGAGEADEVAALLGTLGLLTALTTGYLALRPEHPEPSLTDGDEARVRALLDRHGARDSLGYFALRRDKSVLFSPTGKAAVAYRVVQGVMLASGDPVGDVEAWPGAIAEFTARARAHAWVPAVVGCSETGAGAWVREAGLDALEIGDEAVVETAEFSLSGREMRNVRQMVRRVERQGWTCRVRRVGELDRAERQEIAEAADRWRGTGTERGFSMALGRFGDPADDACVVATAHGAPREEGAARGAPGRLGAVLHFVPWGSDGISLELMRRDRAAAAGLNELLIVAVLQAAPRLGVRRVSLNFAVFRSALARGERIGAGPVLRVWRRLLLLLSRWFQIESLYRFNAKFRPQWVPRFLVYPSARDLPRIGLAVLRAEAFVDVGLPRLRRSRGGGSRSRRRSATRAPGWRRGPDQRWQPPERPS
ncbi:phosphatidylglycerol lysyltransferase domain-containing protein [Streptomyces sp. NPDC059506]|uniref:phosphatidylglycerol lysyltransferase domain-containing protein n=1 Tax=Streptomyces TaxID=1883 RepID=UPI0015FA23A7|nr:phosphatidylglycerol lysyltransferase domain-containing protein [Streptomyces sp. SCUT-3]QMV23553.1 DUF2156 domain-containing protein [Streptomyces sp. SCUT-3]